MSFRLGNLIPAVEPTIGSVEIMEFGEHFRGQSGTAYSNINGKKFLISLEFERLTRTEKNELEKYAMATSSSPYINLEMQERDRIFDGVTVDPNLGRVLQKVKIVPARWEIKKYDDSTDDNQSLYTASVTVEET
jgi:hypothetical protein